MLIHGDVKGLEVVCAAYLSQDATLCAEIRDGVDLHDDNRIRFDLGQGKEGRLTAKKFKFRLIYGGSAFSYAHDADFQHLRYSVKRWQEIINEYYEKYKGLKLWHDGLVQTVTLTNQLVMPTGRIYRFEPFVHPSRGLIWPRTKILNYPVQGLGADLVAIARVTLRKRMKKQELTEALLVNTVHDSIDIDTPEHLTYNICSLIKQSVEDVPTNFERLFGKPFNLPLVAEVFYGPNLKEMEKYENYSP